MGKFLQWRQPLMALAAMIMLIFISYSVLHDFAGRESHTIMIDLKDDQDPFETLPSLLLSQEIQEVREVDRSKNQFRVTIKSKQSEAGLLKRLLGADSVEDACIDEMCIRN